MIPKHMETEPVTHIFNNLESLKAFASCYDPSVTSISVTLRTWLRCQHLYFPDTEMPWSVEWENMESNLPNLREVEIVLRLQCTQPKRDIKRTELDNGESEDVETFIREVSNKASEEIIAEVGQEFRWGMVIRVEKGVVMVEGADGEELEEGQYG